MSERTVSPCQWPPVVVFALALGWASAASAWTVEADFESGTVGENAGGEQAFSGAASNTLFSSDQVHSGSQSAISTIEEGSEGFGDWGGGWRFPSVVREGGEVWYRVWVYYPDGFDFTCSCSEGIKFLRLFTRADDRPDGTEGSWDYYLARNGVVIATGVNGPEFYGNHPWPHEDIRGLGGPISTNVWHAYEFYVRFSSVSGEGIIRAWKDGELLFEDTETATLTSANSVVSRATLWTYWNNRAPATQSAYVDDVVVTTDQPMGRDAAGNAFIGIGAPVEMRDAGPGSDAGASLDGGSTDAGTPDGGAVTDGGFGGADAATPDGGVFPDSSAESDAGAMAEPSTGCAVGGRRVPIPTLLLVGAFVLFRRRIAR